MKEKSKQKENKIELDENINISHNDDVIDEEESFSEKIKSLREKLEICSKEKGEYLAGWQRAKADFINQGRELDKWKGEFIEFANKSLIDELLPVMDSFNLAFSNKEAWGKVDKNWRTGVEYIYTQLNNVLKDHGLSTFGSAGDKFDPNKHSAVENITTENEDDDGKISEIFQQGFVLKDKVLRPAKVKVFSFKK